MHYLLKYSNFLKVEIKRLESGNTTEKKRAVTISEKISAVVLDPLNSIYQKTLPDSYAAIAVGERFRLFFKPIPALGIVYFAWINDEDFPHTTGSVHDCYREFTRMHGNGEIEPYVHDKILKNEFKKSSDWGASYIYVQFRRLSTQAELFANSHITLSQTSNKQYELRSISVDEEDKGLASDLLENLVLDADQNGIELYYHLILGSSNLEKSRYLLRKFKFDLYGAEDDIEIWIRTPR